MTALEEIKKGNHPDRIWATVNGASTRLPDGARQLIGGWSQDADRAGAAEYVLASTLESLQRENEALKNLIDGDNCADPDKIDALFRRAEAAEAEVKRLQAEIDRKSSMPGDRRYWEGRYRDEAAENERLNAILEPFRTVSKDWVDENGWTDVACQKDRIVDWFGPSDFRALASTGGEHHAE